MPSLIDQPDRHTIIDARRGHYLCFPDVCMADGRLLAVYNDYDQHVGTRRHLLLKTSADQGRTWSRHRRLPLSPSHCPRLSRLADGTIFLADDQGHWLTSRSRGRVWKKRPANGLGHGIQDRVLELEGNELLTTGHNHRGTFAHPATRQPTTEQMVYLSKDRGFSWRPLSVMAHQRNLVLCEASMVRLADGRILGLLRENSFVFEPMYLCVSEDNGRSWSDPAPTPLVGHRPTLGIWRGDQLLVTYRDVGPNPGTCAWSGTPEELASDYRVHGLKPDQGTPLFTPHGMRVANGDGPNNTVRYALRPLTDPRSASAVLEARVRVDHAGPNGCGLRLGVWFRIFPDRVEPEDGKPVPLKPGRFHDLRVEYADGVVRLSVDGKATCHRPCDPDHADTRPILFGAPLPAEDNAVDATWQRVGLHVREPRFLREHRWEWHADQSTPDQWIDHRVLRLADSPRTAYGDFGYSGWTLLPDGSVFCAYHHADGTAPGYEVNRTCHIRGTRFSPEDFA